MKKTGFLFAAIGLLLALGAAVLIFGAPRETEWRTVSLGAAKVQAEVADTPAKLVAGLSGRESLPAGQGMLFVLAEPGRPSFWMKDMKFPLDFIYLYRGRVAQTIANVRPPSPGEEPVPFAPEATADAVLEVNAGFVAEHGLKAGDSADY